MNRARALTGMVAVLIAGIVGAAGLGVAVRVFTWAAGW